MNDDRQILFSGTREVRPAHRFDEARLCAWMRDHVDGFTEPLTVQQFKGGQSNPTYQLLTPNQNYVLRRKPPGKLLPSAHAVDREFRVISALDEAGFPVPRPFALCEDTEVVGTMFYIMASVDGRIVWNPLIPESTKEERAGIYDAMNATLAQLHMLEPEAVGLGDFGRPGNYIARQIHRWSKQYMMSATETIPTMDALIKWLPNAVPDSEECSIVHGDYRLDNMILHPTRSQVRAVLDWELSTLGHPLGDFTYHLMQWFMPTLPGRPGGAATLLGSDLAELGIPDADAYTHAYCLRTNRPDIPNRAFYMAYNFFRLAGILQGIAGRVRDGTAASEHAEDNTAAVKGLAEAGYAWSQQVR